MCVLRVTGKEFDVDRQLAASEFTPCHVFRKGEPRSASQPDGKRHEVSGFTVDVSRASRSSLVEQARDAVAFLKQHRAALAALRSAPGMEDMRLDFPVDLRIDRKTVMAQFDYFPPELVSLAGSLGLGLEISIYPTDLEELARARTSAKSREQRSDEPRARRRRRRTHRR
jgi:hypothetical protein